MNYLLDTNVVSEWVKPQPDIGVIEWLEQIDEDRAFICAVTIAELRHGIERLARGNRRKRLEVLLFVCGSGASAVDVLASSRSLRISSKRCANSFSRPSAVGW